MAAPLLQLRIPSQREILERHLEHVTGVFRAAGWHVERDPGILPKGAAGATCAIMSDPWLEPLPEAVAALASAPCQGRSWRVPMLPHAEPPQQWRLSSGPYTLDRYQRSAVVGRARALENSSAGPLCYGLVATSGSEIAELLDLGWPPPSERLALVPEVRVFRYDDPAGHSRAELVDLVPKDAASVVDIGCGSGRLGELLRKPGRRIIGIEPDSSLAAAAAERLDEVLVLPAEEGLAALAAPAEVLILADVLEHTDNPEGVLRATKRSLAADGTVIVSLPNTSWMPVLEALARGRWDPTLAGVQARDHLRPMTPSSFRRMAAECGLAVRSEIPMIAPLPLRTRFAARLVSLFGARYLDLVTAQWVAILDHSRAEAWR